MMTGLDDRGRLLPGTVVRSRAGRDRGHIYIVIEDDGVERVIIADGATRGLMNTKKKNRKHLRVIGCALPASAFDDVMRDTPCVRERDTMIRKLLNPFQKR
ncbi:MAG: hypothetical protein GX924_04800 [Clostridiaceae bacterium]|jgi:hypothetical protein|nr:hypothetical protein [Clostridiaceae bacterium]